jgi:hypothetical protein
MNLCTCSCFTIILHYVTVNPPIEEDPCWSPDPLTPLILATIEQENEHLPSPSIEATIDWSPDPPSPLVLATMEEERIDRSTNSVNMSTEAVDEQPSTSSGVKCELCWFLNPKIRLTILSFYLNFRFYVVIMETYFNI